MYTCHFLLLLAYLILTVNRTYAKNVSYYRYIINPRNRNVFLANIFLSKIKIACVFIFTFFLQIFYFNILSYRLIFRHTYICHDRPLEIKFVENISRFSRYGRSIEKNALNSMQDDVTIR